MTKCNGSMTTAQFFDSVLAEIELGRVEQGIHQLVGMLDAQCMTGGALFETRVRLSDHVLHHLLRQDPLYAHADQHPNDTAGLSAILGETHDRAGISATGRRLIAVTRKLPVAVALQHRRMRFDRLIARAWQDGARIGIIGAQSSDIPLSLAGRDTSNIHVVNTLDDPGLEGGVAFDLLCAPNLADAFETQALFDHLNRFQKGLAPHGRIILTALLPHHPGSGWRQACLRWRACTHDETTLRASAQKAGFSAHIYRDESDCAFWAELSVTAKTNHKGQAKNGH
jgi:hypothetical protein